MRLLHRRSLLLSLALAGAGLAAAPLAAEGVRLALPAEYRSWRHVRSIAVTDPDHAMHGFHDGYANAAAVRGLRARPVRFEEGATFVVALHDIAERGGITTAGAKRRTVMQVKDRAATATGGWRFAAFDPDGTPLAIDEAHCFSCHQRARDRDHVLTDLRE